MPTDTVPYGRKTQKPSPVAEVHILWMTAGLGCDGDSVSITAATQPGIEDFRSGGGRIDPQREDQKRRLLGGDGNR
jgi:hydrogenase small subunit